jgi:hypothetical protein
MPDLGVGDVLGMCAVDEDVRSATAPASHPDVPGEIEHFGPDVSNYEMVTLNDAIQ